MKTSRLIVFGVLVAALATIAAPAVQAGNGQPAPKATGDITFNVGLAGSMQFEAIQTWATCAATWNVAGAWVFDFTYGGAYAASYEATLTQSGATVGSTNFGYPVAGPPYDYTQTVVTGTVTGSTITLQNVYTSGSGTTTPTEFNMVGSIAADGSMSGTWTDTWPDDTGDRSGTWSTFSGAATKVVTGCSGKGSAHLAYANGSWYDVEVQYVNVTEDDAWFAGLVTASSSGWEGNWAFFKVHDGGEPAYLVDQVWGSFTTQAAAMLGVATMANPADGPFSILGGNLQVH